MSDAKRKKKDPPRLVRSLEELVVEALPGFRALDRELVVDGKCIAELLGALEGRLALVVESDDGADRACLRALDALAFCRRHGAALARHVELELEDARAPCAVLLLVPRIAPELRERLGAFLGREVLLFERHELASARGLEPFVARDPLAAAGCAPAGAVVTERGPLATASAGPGPEAADPAPPASRPGSRPPSAGRPAERAAAQAEDWPPAPPAAHDPFGSDPDPAGRGGRRPESAAAAATDAEPPFLPELAEPDRAVALELIARLDRVDSDLRRARRGAALVWSFDGEELCSLRRGPDGGLEGRLEGSAVPHAIRDAAAIDVFLDWVLGQHLERLEAAAGPPLAQVELQPVSAEPLLSAEELEAFRE